MNIARQPIGVGTVVLLLGVGTLNGLAAAQQPTPAQASAIRQACRGDYMANCSGVPTGGPEALQCLQQNVANVSPGCQQALRAASDSQSAPATAAAAPARPAAPAASTPVAATWPHSFTGDGGSALVYQPQVISWPDRGTLNTRMAIAITPTGAKTPALGTMQVAFDTQTDLDTRYVTLTNPKLVSTQFPTLDTNRAVQFANAITAGLGRLGDKQVPLDSILLSLRQQTGAPPAPPMKNDPPAIFRSERPASLVVFDGEPVLSPVGDTTIQAAVNTNWDVFFYPANATWYLLNNGVWFSASAYRGPWAPAARLPGVFYTIPSDANFAKVRAQIPGRTIAASDAPTIFVSTVPAEIIVTIGAPRFQRIPGTGLSYVSNTSADLFQESSTGTFYYLVSGRWFSAPSLDGPWTFATGSLPPGFAQIPPSGPRGSVLVSVPGTPQAQEALIQAQIPQQGVLSRATAKLEVVYSGPPEFRPIAGTTLYYAVNTPYDVIRVGNVYYSCYQGAWFTAPAPTGVWVLADSVPEVIYTIPVSSPLYYVTYVKVYGSTTTTVTYGYTVGYTMGYVSTGVVVYGTGWYYPPYVYPAPIPIFYPYPYSYAGAVYYNSTTGAWARGGVVYGPYGGVAEAGTAYNPTTGAWAHGAAVYGPNGGAGAWSAYNPSTGSYAHGSASWGGGTGSANASWYNARTGVSGTTNQNYNQYGRWGSSQISGPNQTVDTRSQTTAQGSAGAFKSTSGAEGAGVRGAGGQSAGVVKGPGGDVYAGADGNVYRHTSDGWQKYDDGSWNSVTPPSRNTSPGSAAPGSQAAGQSPGSSQERPGQAGGGASGQRFANSESGQQLNQDRFARTQGDARQQQFNQWRQGGEGLGGERFGGGRFAAGGFGGFRGRR